MDKRKPLVSPLDRDSEEGFEVVACNIVSDHCEVNKLENRWTAGH